MKEYVIACGGTGGHISPGISVAEELIQRGNKCTLVLSNKSVDRQMMQKYHNIDHIVTTSLPFSKNPIKFLKFLFSQFKALLEALVWLKKRNVACIIGFGGFTNAPFIIAGFFLRKKIVLHESNRVIGKSIKFLSFLADKVYLGPNMRFSLKFLDKKVQHIGYPLRKEFQKIDQTLAKRALKINEASKLVLVIGGSQGAKILTTWALENYKSLNQKNIFLYCLTGEMHFVDSGNVFEKFSNDMCTLYNAADIIVSRAGAGTIAEATFFEKYMILVPYKYAAEDHQTQNAKYIKSVGLGDWLPEERIDDLNSLIIRLLTENNFNLKLKSKDIKNPVTEIVNYVTK